VAEKTLRTIAVNIALVIQHFTCKTFLQITG